MTARKGRSSTSFQTPDKPRSDIPDTAKPAEGSGVIAPDTVIAERTFLGILETSPLAMGYLKGDRVVWVNKAFCTLSGFSPEELEDARWRMFFESDEEYESVRGGTSELSRAVEVRFARKNGIGRNVHIQSWSTDGSNCIFAVSGIAEETELEGALRLTQFSVDMAFDGTVWLANGGAIVYANNAASHLTGYSKDELLSMTVFDLDRDYTKIEWEKNRPYLREKGALLFESRHWRKDGRVYPVEVSVSYIEYGGIEYHCTVFRDITDRKQFETALKESEAQYRSVVENSLVGFYVIQDDRFRFVNKRFCEIFGYRPEEILNTMSPIDLVHPDDRKMVEENIRMRLSGETDHIEYEFRRARKDGSLITLKVLGGAMIYDGRQAAFGTLMDITREKTLESQLRQAQKMEAIGALAGGIAHDFNNILTALTGYASLIQMKMPKADPLQIYLDQILSASLKASNLTHSLLTFSRQRPVTLNPVNINILIRETEKLLRRLLTEDITLKTSFGGEEMTIMADATQMDQILFNLTTNARDSMPKGGTLAIETRLIELDAGFTEIHGFLRPGSYVLLSISDTGFGMDQMTKDHIFDPFFTTKDVGKGTGLGLSTVYGIVKQHDGYVAVYSEPGIGTSVHVYLPLVKNGPPEEQSVRAAPRGGHETILVAEDSDGVRNLMQEVLTEYGYRVIEAIDGEDAIARFRDNTDIDLLILDSVMPRKNGREVYEAARAINPHVRALFTSGYTRDVVLDKGIEDKDIDFIPKPLSPALLLEKIRVILDRDDPKE